MRFHPRELPPRCVPTRQPGSGPPERCPRAAVGGDLSILGGSCISQTQGSHRSTAGCHATTEGDSALSVWGHGPRVGRCFDAAVDGASQGSSCLCRRSCRSFILSIICFLATDVSVTHSHDLRGGSRHSPVRALPGVHETMRFCVEHLMTPSIFLQSHGLV